MDGVGTLPGEIGTLVLELLEGRDLLTCAVVGSWTWHALARHRVLWKRLALGATREKQRSAVHLLHLRLLDNNTHRDADAGAQAQSGSEEGEALGEERWGWAEWARAYFAAQSEGKRQRLSGGEELVAHRWRFAFRPESFVAGQTQPPPTHVFYPHFHSDGTYEHTGLFSTPLGWRFIDTHDYDGTLGRRLVQIHRFPPLRVRRTPDWGWVLENDFVLFESEDPELERKRRKREQQTKRRIAALPREELAALSRLSDQDVLSKLKEWKIDLKDTATQLSTKDELVAAVVAHVECVRDELRKQEAAKCAEVESARRNQESHVK